MIAKILGIEKMSISQCQELAKKIGSNSATFDLVGPNGRMKAKWLNAYMGLFTLEGRDGFIMVDQIQFIPDLYCENLLPKSEEEK